MAILGREALENHPTAEFVEMEVKEWGGSILLRFLPTSLANRYQAMLTGTIDTKAGRIIDPGLMTKLLALGVVWSWVNESGELVLTDKDADRLAQEPYAVLDKINAKIRKINGLLEETQKTAVEDAKKNSEPTPSEDFGMS